jgi:hypothetical protein
MGAVGVSRLEADANHSSEQERTEDCRTEVATEVRCEKVLSMSGEGTGVTLMVEVLLEVREAVRELRVSEVEEVVGGWIGISIMSLRGRKWVAVARLGR